MEDLVGKIAIAFLGVVLAFPGMTAWAQENDPTVVLTENLKAHAPLQWHIRVRWQDQTLLASIAPLPYQEAFDLWYDSARLLRTLRDLCPGSTEKVWTLVKPDQDIVLEPSIGGKSAAEARVSCRTSRPGAG
jgi:hypothetical protein